MTSGSQTSTVAVFREAGQPLQLQTVPVPELQPGQTLVRIDACTICGSDLHTFTGRRDGPLPMVLGHEIIGTIVAYQPQRVGDPHPQTPKEGDRITWSIAASCGGCHRCETGLPQKCDSLFKYGHENFDASPLSGGLGELAIIEPGTTIVPLPEGLPDEVACPANCATATVAAGMRIAGDVSDRRVLIMGAGMLGLTASAFAITLGASEVVVCDVNDTRLQRAADFGATQLVNGVNAEDFDIAFEMSGSSVAVSAAIESLTVGGKAILVGSVSPSKSVAIDPEQVVRRVLSIFGVHNYHPDDLRTAVAFLHENHNQFPFADLVDAKFPLSESQAAMIHAETERPIRVLVRP